jgi:lysophospholipase L1-like esterase
MRTVYIICIIIIIFLIILRANIQGFTAMPKSFIILGDSILKNNKYVPHDKSIEFILTKNIGNTNKLLFLAEDDSRISDLEKQLSGIQETNTYIFISTGGNDILQHIYMRTLNSTIINKIFLNYTSTINTIINTYKPNRIYLLNLYFPTDSSMQPFYKYITEWNNLLEEYIKSNSLTEIIRINDICNDKSDFVDVIEPSESCSVKIANKILNIL